MIFDKIELCKGLLNLKHSRRSVKDSEEDPTVPSTTPDTLMNLMIVVPAEEDCI